MDGDARRRLSLLINAAAEAAQNSSSPLSSSWVTLNIDESGEPSPTPLIKALPEQLVGAPAAAPEQLVGAPAAAGARTVADLRPRSILTLADRLSVEEAAKRMAGMKTDAAVVVNNAGALIGILTDTDVTRKVLAPGLDPAAVHVTDAMTASPRCVLSTTSAVGALTTMVEHRFRHLPVLEAEEAGDGGGALRCVGLLDIAKCLYDAISAIDAAVTGGGAPTLAIASQLTSFSLRQASRLYLAYLAYVSPIARFLSLRQAGQELEVSELEEPVLLQLPLTEQAVRNDSCIGQPFEDAAATRAHIRARLREIMGRDHGLLENTQEPTPNQYPNRSHNLTITLTVAITIALTRGRSAQGPCP